MAKVFAGDFNEKAERAGGTSTKEHFDIENSKVSVTRIFEGPWANRFTFIFNEILPEFVDSGTGTVFNFPAAYPDIPIAFASTVDIIGAGVSSQNEFTGNPIWERAVIEVAYTSRPFTAGVDNKKSKGQSDNLDNYRKGVYVEESVESDIQMVNIPGEGIKAKDGGAKFFKLGYIAKSVPLITIILKLHNIIRPNWMRITSILGKVNDSPFITPSGFVAETEKLRYDGPSGFTRVNIRNGAGENFPLPLWDMSHRFVYNPLGWNKKYDEGGKLIDILLSEDSRLFETTDLWSLISRTGPDDSTLISLDTALRTLNANVDTLGWDSDLIRDTLNTIDSIKASLGFRA